MIVEGLVPDPRRPGSTRVMVGGRPAWTVPADVVAGLGLTVGQSLGGAAVARLDEAADEEGAFRAGLRALERRAHAERELVRKLERKGHPSSAVRAALDRMSRLELIDDLAFARAYVSARTARGWGPSRLRRDLALLGVERTIIDRAVAEVVADDDDPLARPRALAARRAGQLVGLPRDARRRRLTAFLGRRGYGGADARVIVDALLRADVT